MVSLPVLPLLSSSSSVLWPLPASCLPLLGGSPVGGRLDSPPPSLDPCSRWSGSAAPSLPAAGCSSHPHGWGIPHRSLPVPASGSILPWAAGVGAPGTGVAVLDASPAPFPASGLLFPHFPHFPRPQQPSRPAQSRQHGAGARSSILVCSGFHRALCPYLGHWWEGVAGVLPSSLALAPVLPESLYLRP